MNFIPEMIVGKESVLVGQTPIDVSTMALSAAGKRVNLCIRPSDTNMQRGRRYARLLSSVFVLVNQTEKGNFLLTPVHSYAMFIRDKPR